MSTKMIKCMTLSLLASTLLHATNGDHMIGLAVESRSMGSVGIAKSFGAGSGLANGALLRTVENKELTATVTLFNPNVKSKSTAFGQKGTLTDSDADFSIIPELYYASRLNENIVYGFIIAGTAGMGTDYNDAPEANVNQMLTELMLMKIALPLSYQMDSFALGITPILQYGKLNISHTAPPGPDQDNTESDIGFGAEVGVAYDIIPSLTLGAIYKTKIAMEYKNVMSRSIAAFGQTANITSGDKLTQPAEFGVGLSYNYGDFTFAIDYRNIDWANAIGYRDFGWESQDVLAVGYEYKIGDLAIRGGYNYAPSPIVEQAEVGNGAGSAKNFFNLAGFPAIVESHFTGGLGYQYSKSLSYNISGIYAAKKEDTFTTAAFSFPQGTNSTVYVNHSQIAVTLGVIYKF